MRVEVVKSFGTHSVGAIIPEMPAGQGRTLIARGLVREVTGYETKPEPSPANRMMKPARGRKDFVVGA